MISPPPGANVNNSANTTDDPTTSSPEHVPGQRGRVDSDLQVSHTSFRVVYSGALNMRSMAEKSQLQETQ